MSTERGFSLIELVLFIAIVGIAIVGVLTLFNTTNVHSADPLINKQAMAIAESLLSEIEQKPFTYCDPQDPKVLTATGGAGCTTDDQDNGGGTLGPRPAGETRGGADPFDNVADYAGYTQNPAADSTGSNAVAGYASSVAITRVGGSAAFPGLPSGAALRIAVTVTGPNGVSLTLVGYRVRYAPNAPG